MGIAESIWACTRRAPVVSANGENDANGEHGDGAEAVEEREAADVWLRAVEGSGVGSGGGGGGSGCCCTAEEGARAAR